MGFFISFEGIDGSGKTTQIDKAAAWCRAEGYDVLVCREPGGTDLGEAIRDILLDTRWQSMTPRTEYLLYSASRAQLVEEKIKPHLTRKNSIVILDRYFDSSTAYQGGGRGLGAAQLATIHPFVTGHLNPDLTLYLDVDWVTSVHRRRHDIADRLEQNAHDFFDRVRHTYLELCEQDSSRVIRVDARCGVEEVFLEIQKHISTVLSSSVHTLR